MIRQLRSVAVGTLVAAAPVLAQSPSPPQFPAPPQNPAQPVRPTNVSPTPPVGASPPVQPAAPRTLPPGVQASPLQQMQPEQNPNVIGDPNVQLPRKEVLLRIDHPTVNVRRNNESWQLWAGRTLLRDFGANQSAAEEAQRTVRDLKPTEWGTIGTRRVVVEYGLTNGQAPTWAPSPKWALRVDLMSVRAEQIRGAWVLRDDHNILLNFGAERTEAEQAGAVCRRYGFNRVGMVGFPAPLMAYLFAAPVAADETRANDPLAALTLAAQEQQMMRTGVAVPGVGHVGERIVINPRKLDIRKDKGEWVLAHGADVIARFGQSDWVARDAKRAVEDMRVTEVCRVGSSGATFFLTNGVPPTRVPFAAQGSRFTPQGLKVMPINGRFGVFEANGRELLPCDSVEEGQQLVKVIQAFGFDQQCQIGLGSRSGLKFLAKAGR